MSAAAAALAVALSWLTKCRVILDGVKIAYPRRRDRPPRGGGGCGAPTVRYTQCLHPLVPMRHVHEKVVGVNCLAAVLKWGGKRS